MSINLTLQKWNVKNWLHLVPKQFRLYYHGSRFCELDFAVEVVAEMFIIEAKSRRDMQSKDGVLTI